MRNEIETTQNGVRLNPKPISKNKKNRIREKHKKGSNLQNKTA
jgi:hypothetical protein